MSLPNDPQVQALLAPLRDHPPTLSEAQSRAVWAGVQAELSRREARARWLRPAGFTLAVAAAALLLWVTRPMPDTTTPPPAKIVATIYAPGQTLAAQQTLPSGALVQVDGDVTVAEVTTDRVRLTLASGAVTSQVPKLQAGQIYQVETASTLVEVRGTRFTVHSDDGVTTVSVEEGLVQVTPRDGRSARAVRPGETWRVEPLSPQGARTAERNADWQQAGEIWSRLVKAAPDDLTTRNRWLREARRLDATPVGASLWRSLSQRYTAGAHAQEFAWRSARDEK